MLNSWFSQWNRCEQTISLYALLSRVSAEQARFLMLVLEHNLQARSEGDKQDLEGVAEQANSAGKLVTFLAIWCFDAMSRLLSLLVVRTCSCRVTVSWRVRCVARDTERPGYQLPMVLRKLLKTRWRTP